MFGLWHNNVMCLDSGNVVCLDSIFHALIHVMVTYDDVADTEVYMFSESIVYGL